MDVNIGVFVSACDFFVVNFRKPVVCGDCAAVAENKSADGISDRGVFFHAPVFKMDVIVDDFLIVKYRRLHITDLFTLFSVKNVCLRNVGVARLFKDVLDAVLDVFDVDEIVFNLAFEIGGNAERQHVDDCGNVLLVLRLKRFGNGDRDFVKIKIGYFTVSFNYLIHFPHFLYNFFC